MNEKISQQASQQKGFFAWLEHYGVVKALLIPLAPLCVSHCIQFLVYHYRSAYFGYFGVQSDLIQPLLANSFYDLVIQFILGLMVLLYLAAIYYFIDRCTFTVKRLGITFAGLIGMYAVLVMAILIFLLIEIGVSDVRSFSQLILYFRLVVNETFWFFLFILAAALFFWVFNKGLTKSEPNGSMPLQAKAVKSEKAQTEKVQVNIDKEKQKNHEAQVSNAQKKIRYRKVTLTLFVSFVIVMAIVLTTLFFSAKSDASLQTRFDILVFEQTTYAVVYATHDNFYLAECQMDENGVLHIFINRKKQVERDSLPYETIEFGVPPQIERDVTLFTADIDDTSDSQP